jgi:hypothetical protein
MEKDGWLDQLLLGILNVLNHPLLAVVVALGGGFAVALLARLSPKEDWEFIKEGPGVVLTGAFLVLAGVKSAPRLVLPETDFVCDRTTGPLGIPVTGDCRLTSTGTTHVVHDYTFVDFLQEYFSSLGLELVLGGLGAGLGILVARIVRRRRVNT